LSKSLGLRHVAAAALGGAYLGGGGGGSLSEGRRLGELAVNTGKPRLAHPEELGTEGIVLTVSAVGSPAQQEAAVDAVDYVRAVELFVETFGVKPAGLIANECGGMATLNGWLQSACLGIPVVDAPCNGRAHPTGIMGSMGLHRVAEYQSLQTAVGGNQAAGNRVELAVRGSLASCAAMVRHASVQAGGLVAVARNPVPAGYLMEHGAVGAVSRAIAVGRVALAASAGDRAERVAAYLGGAVAARGTVEAFELKTRGGFDVGRLILAGGGDGPAEITFWNEYITLEIAGRRVATFPDLIVTLDREGFPLSSAEVRAGQGIQVLAVPAAKLLLGAGMRDPALFEALEAATGKQIVAYAFGRA
jgi:hypothetical protein